MQNLTWNELAVEIDQVELHEQHHVQRERRLVKVQTVRVPEHQHLAQKANQHQHQHPVRRYVLVVERQLEVRVKVEDRVEGVEGVYAREHEEGPGLPVVGAHQETLFLLFEKINL